MVRVKGNPKQFLLIDGAGAAISALLIGVVLVQFHSEIGLSISILYVLALVPLVFVLYDGVAYLFCKNHYRCLLGIALMNLVYCVFSAIVLILYRESLTALGWIYFLLELMIVVPLALYELKLSNSKVV